MNGVGWVQENDRLRPRREEVCFGSLSREYHRSWQDIIILGTVRLVSACECVDVIYDRVDGVLDGMSASGTDRSKYRVWTHVETMSSG